MLLKNHIFLVLKLLNKLLNVAGKLLIEMTILAHLIPPKSHRSRTEKIPTEKAIDNIFGFVKVCDNIYGTIN